MGNLKRLTIEATKARKEVLEQYYNFEDQYGEWKVSVKPEKKDSIAFPPLPDTIDGKKITNLNECYAGCTNLKIPPQLPKYTQHANLCFAGCSSLAVPPDLSRTNLKKIEIAGICSDCVSMCSPLISQAEPDTRIIVALTSNGEFAPKFYETTIEDLYLNSDDIDVELEFTMSDLIDIISSPNNDGIIEIGETSRNIDGAFSTTFDVVIVASETYSAGRNLSNMAQFNIDATRFIHMEDTLNAEKVFDVMTPAIIDEAFSPRATTNTEYNRDHVAPNLYDPVRAYAGSSLSENTGNRGDDFGDIDDDGDR